MECNIYTSVFIFASIKSTKFDKPVTAVEHLAIVVYSRSGLVGQFWFTFFVPV